MSLLTTISGASSLYTTTTTCIDEEGQIIPKRRNTAISTTVTTATCGTLQSLDEFRVLNKAQTYVESLSKEELATLDQMLSEKEMAFGNQENVAINVEKPKVKEKSI